MACSLRTLAAMSAASLLIAAPSSAQEPAPALVLEPFSLRGFDGTEQTAELGRLTVPADRGDPASGTIELVFARLASTADSPGSPIVFLAGGPGVPGIVMGQIPVYRSLFERWRIATCSPVSGDLRSSPCSTARDDSLRPTPSSTRPTAGALLPRRSSGSALLAEQGVARRYTTAAARDVDYLRRALRGRFRILGSATAPSCRWRTKRMAARSTARPGLLRPAVSCQAFFDIRALIAALSALAARTPRRPRDSRDRSAAR